MRNGKNGYYQRASPAFVGQMKWSKVLQKNFETEAMMRGRDSEMVGK
jgi:hypothetical protein